MSDPQPAEKRGPDAEPENDSVRHQAENPVGETVKQIPDIPVTAVDVKMPELKQPKRCENIKGDDSSGCYGESRF